MTGLAFFLAAWLIVAFAVSLLVCDLAQTSPDDLWDDDEDTDRWA